jgi:hypothetical protein
MNERDFDNIFRRKIEQIPTPLPDENLWQNLNTSLGNTPTPRATQWSKMALLALLLSLVASNVYFWKKLNSLTNNSVKSEIKYDTINKQTIVYQYDTIVKNIYIKEKTTILRAAKSSEKSLQRSTKNNFEKSQNANDLSNATKGKLLQKSTNNDKIIVENGSEIITENSKEIQKEKEVPKSTEEKKTTQNTNDFVKESVVQIENTVEKVDSLSQNKETQTIQKDSSAVATFTAVKENKKNVEDFIPVPSNIEPVKKSIFSRIELGLQAKTGFLLGSNHNETGDYSSLGFSLATRLASHYRLFAEVDFEKVSLDRRDSSSNFGVKKPIISNKDERFHHWEIRQQPVVQYHIGVTRFFSWKKLEPSVGVAVGAMSVLPFEVRYQTEHENNKERKDYLAGKNSNSQTFLSDIKAQLGLRYQLKKGFSVALNADYQYFINQKSNWQHQLGVGAGLHYTF